MAMTQEREIIRYQRRRASEAVQSAMENRWEDAAQANRDIIAMMPNDPHAYNRLGKAMLELGRYAESRDAYARALEVDSANTIARKNLARLASLGEEGPAAGEGEALRPHLFIAETGRSGTTELSSIDPGVLARATPGDQVELRRTESGLAAYTKRGERLGDVEPRMGVRLANLMEGGNMYASAIVSVGDDQCRIIIREVFQHASMAGKPSFSGSAGATSAESFRPYTKERLIRTDASVTTEDFDDDEEPDEWDGDDSGAEALDDEAQLSDRDDDSDEDNDDSFD